MTAEHTLPKPILRLSPQLTNQIAAGEVVERPASVVKELLENSLDAGATQIQIEIEQGGAQRILLQDNGVGIAKDDLSLALTRHATSKITDLSDLEQIESLGFRGEALASISSVSRLTLTSRPHGQAEAWLAYAEGRDMAVEIKPASHPTGTTIEVANLFFNTPARRRFLRSEKTEFAHLDEVIKRIAIAKPNVTISLSHNGKKLRHYKAVKDDSLEQAQQRLRAICGNAFADNAVHFHWQHQEMTLEGWLCTAPCESEMQYSYVNGRMMRDKVLQHAIKQAYQAALPALTPAFVLFLTLDPRDVDVNVHPTKHEVRFQQSRLVHDFVFQGVFDALEQSASLPFDNLAPHQANRASAGENQFNERAPNASAQTLRQDEKLHANGNEAVSAEPTHAAPFSLNAPAYSAPRAPSRTHNALYQQLLQTDPAPRVAPDERSENGDEAVFSNPTEAATPFNAIDTASQALAPVELKSPSPLSDYLQPLALVADNQAILFQQGQQFWLLRCAELARLRLSQQLAAGGQAGLLIPIAFTLTPEQKAGWECVKNGCVELGFDVEEKTWQQQTKLCFTRVPQALRQHNLQQLMMGVIEQASADSTEWTAADLSRELAKHLPDAHYQSFSEALNALSHVTLDADFYAACLPVDFAKLL